MFKGICLALTFSFLLTACGGSHLEIFPELTDPKLMTKKLSIEEMHQDIDALVEGVLTRHPDLAAYANLAKLKAAANAYKVEITQPMTRAEFYPVVGKLSHHFNDGHSFLIWPYQELNLYKEQGNKLFPFDVVITQGGEVLVKHAYTFGEQKILAGSRIKSVNGYAVNELVPLLQQYMGGETAHLREQLVASRFGLSLWSVLGLADEFQLELAQENGQTSNVTLSANQAWQLTNSQDSQQEHYFKVLKAGVGFLYLGHFDINPDDFEDFIDDTFAQIKQENIETLIIDIRDNPGGNTDTVTYLSRYLANKPFRLVSSMREKLNQQNRGIFHYKGELGETLEEDWNDWQEPMSANKVFRGKAYLLISPVSYSSAIVLATTLKDNGFATLVGETTGGFANQTAQGNLFNLPNSQLRAYVATRLLVRPSGDLTRQGVQPHHQIYNDIDDIKAGRDAAIEFILNSNNLGD